MSEKFSVKVNPNSKGMKIKNGILDKSVQHEMHEDILKKQNAEHYKKGYNDGQQQVRKELENIYAQKLLGKFNELHSMFSDFDEKMIEYGVSFEEVVVKMSVIIAEKVIKRELEMKSTIRENLKESMKKVIGANEILVRLSPKDYKEFNEDGAEFLRDGSYAKIRFEPDDRISQGGCYVETEIGNVDSRIETQMNEIQKQLEAAYASESVQ